MFGSSESESDANEHFLCVGLLRSPYTDKLLSMMCWVAAPNFLDIALCAGYHDIQQTTLHLFMTNITLGMDYHSIEPIEQLKQNRFWLQHWQTCSVL